MTRTFAIAAAVVAFASTASPAVANSGPVGRWQLDDGAGITAADTSGFGDNGTLAGGVGWVVSPRATALQFDGETGRVQIPDARQLEPRSAVSVSAWIARQGTPGQYRYILSKGATGCSAASYGLYTGPHSGLVFYVSSDRGTSFVRSPDAGRQVWDGNWHFVVGTFDGSTIRLYVDGTEVGSGTPYSGTLTYQLFDSNALYIGDYPGCERKNFLGEIGSVQIWNRALGAAEIYDMLHPPVRPVLPPVITPPSGRPTVYPMTPGTILPGDTVSHLLSGLTLRRSTFTTLGIKALTIAYKALHAGRATFTLFKLVPGRCLKPGTAAHGKCTRYVAIGTFTHSSRAGLNSVRLPNRLRKLKPGRYRLVVTVMGAKGAAGHTVAVAFRVVR